MGYINFSCDSSVVKDTRTVPHRILVNHDTVKVTTSAGGSLGAWVINMSEQFGPVVDILAGMVAIGAGVLAMIWTAANLYDRYRDRKNR